MPALRPSMYDMTSSEWLTKRQITLPLAHLRDWKPFQIDALGLVTLLGADEVNQSVGTLQHRRYTEYLPLLAAFVVAGDRFVAEQPGFVLYNLTDGITSTELKGWFTRWLMSQKIDNATTALYWEHREQSTDWQDAIAPALSCALVMPLLVTTILVGDWYGVGNAGAIIISIFTRVYLLSQRRHARDRVANPNGSKTDEKKSLCIIRSDGKMVTCYVPYSVLQTFIKPTAVERSNVYHCARWICWLALGVHMCILGMCSLFTQIYTVLLLVLSTWWFTSDFSWDIGREKIPAENARSVFHIPFNKYWRVKQINHAQKNEKKNTPGPDDRRLIAWARMKLDDKHEQAMYRWNLFPIKEQSLPWWEEYEKEKESFKNDKNYSPLSTSRSTTPSPPRSTTSSTMPTKEEISPSASPG